MSVLDRVFAVSRGEPADSTLSPDVPLASFSCLPCSPLLSAATLAPTRVSESSPPTPPTPTGPCVQRVSALRFLWTFGWHLISAVLRCTSPPFLVEKVPGDDPAVSADAGPPPTVDAYEQLDPSDPGASPPAPAKPWAFDYDFLEVGTSGGFVARQLAAGNFCVGPLVDRRCSRQYDLGASPLRDWLVHLVSESKVRALWLSPPSGGFHPARARSQTPTSSHDLRALATCFLVFSLAVRWGLPVLLTVPRSGSAQRSRLWGRLSRIPGVRGLKLSGVAFAVLGHSGLACLSYGLDLSARDRDASKASRHVVPLSGGCLWASCPSAVRKLAGAFAKALRARVGMSQVP